MRNNQLRNYQLIQAIRNEIIFASRGQRTINLNRVLEILTHYLEQTKDYKNLNTKLPNFKL